MKRIFVCHFGIVKGPNTANNALTLYIHSGYLEMFNNYRIAFTCKPGIASKESGNNLNFLY